MVSLVDAVVPLGVVRALEPAVGDGVAHAQAAEALAHEAVRAGLEDKVQNN